MSTFNRVVTGVTTIVPGPAGTITYIRQMNGPYTGRWLLPGGKVEFGENLVDAARREVHEESGCIVDDLELLGTYEIRGTWAEGPYHLIMFGFLSRDIGLVPTGFDGHNVSAIRQCHPSEIDAHPVVLQMLVDAAVIEVPQAALVDGLERDEISLTRHLHQRAILT